MGICGRREKKKEEKSTEKKWFVIIRIGRAKGSTVEMRFPDRR